MTPVPVLAFAQAADWRAVLRSCLDQIGAANRVAPLGVMFTAGALGEMAHEIQAALRERTGINLWFGAGSSSIFAGRNELPLRAQSGLDGCGGALAVCPLGVPDGGFEAFSSGQAPAAPSLARSGLPWHALVHAAADEPLAAPGAYGGRWVGGRAAAGEGAALVAGGATAGGLCGVSLAGLQIEAGAVDAVRPLGAACEVTGTTAAGVLELDGEPAAAVLRRQAGDLLAKDSPRLLRRAALEVFGADGRRTLTGLSDLPPGGGVTLAEARRARALEGRRVRFVLRDPAAVAGDLESLAGALARRFKRRPQLALLYSSRSRGVALVGEGAKPDEAAAAGRALDRVWPGLPLTGMRTEQELFEGAVLDEAAVLCLIGRPEGAPP